MAEPSFSIASGRGIEKITPKLSIYSKILAKTSSLLRIKSSNLTLNTSGVVIHFR
jgi:hypothetical protein